MVNDVNKATQEAEGRTGSIPVAGWGDSLKLSAKDTQKRWLTGVLKNDFSMLYCRQRFPQQRQKEF